jgi:hypothetical protein
MVMAAAAAAVLPPRSTTTSNLPPLPRCEPNTQLKNMCF